MRIASITEAKNNLSALIDSLKGGSPVLIVDRGRPVARLEPVTGTQAGEQEARLGRLVREGLLRSRRKAPARAVFSSQPPRANTDASIVNAVIEERRDGR
jgi:prevent-host-death family protein